MCRTIGDNEDPLQNLLRLNHLEADLTHQVQVFVSSLLAELDAVGLSTAMRCVDHVCYRVNDVLRYEALKDALAPLATLLAEAYINGRPIATFKLFAPIRVHAALSIDLIELPAPREDAAYDEGFEHMEVVTTGTLEELIAKHGAEAFDMRNFKALVNRDVSVRFPTGLVKFHEASLEHIIAVETQAIKARVARPIAVIDFDDTIAHSREAFLRSVHAGLEHALARSVDFATVRAKAKPTFPEFFANLGVQDASLMREILAAFQAAWPRYAAMTEIPTGVRSMLSCLCAEGVDVHLWTARDQITTRTWLEQTQLLQYFAHIHAFDWSGPGKPCPTKALEDACRAAPSCVLLGDSRADVAAAQAIRARFLQAAWVRRDDLDARADDVCTTPLQALTKMLATFRGKS